MSTLVNEVQYNMFGGLHDFHTERTEVWIDAVREKFGDETLRVIQEKGVDTYGLYRWHLERTLLMIDSLANAFGSEVIDIILNKTRLDRQEQGAQFAKELGRNTLEDIIPAFTHGNDKNIIEKDDKHVLIRTTECLVGKIAYDINRSELVYALHCNLDEYFVQGFNSKLGCEVIQTIVDGHDCCVHRIYVKE